MGIREVGLIVNPSKWQALSFAHEVVAWLAARDITVRVEAEAAARMERPDLATGDGGLLGVDLIITLGGDGTILAASQVAAPHGIPVLGVHMGQFGFIAETHPDDLFADMEKVLAGQAKVEERMMVRGDVVRAGSILHTAYGLNDIVLNKGARTRMLQLETSFGGDFVVSYLADGVVVATPTGSTAYALSAGGPLVEPTVQALMVTPICPHSLAARPLVVPASEVITLSVEANGGEVLLSADSGQVFTLAAGDRVEARRAEFSARIVAIRHASFYHKVRKRLLWGERLNA
ncbi:MAG: NAD(+)/NADH kinase [Chthonomonadales bacterium]|nr:NAD(+)/NADH kinase [Chthonomonadales bacterium]